MANIDETLGQSIENEIEDQEDQISKQGGVGISLEDFTTSGTTNVKNEEDETYKNKQSEDDTLESTRKAEEDVTNIEYDTVSTTLESTVINDIDSLISDIALLDTMNTDVLISQDEEFNEITELSTQQEEVLEEQDATLNVATENIPNEVANEEQPTTPIENVTVIDDNITFAATDIQIGETSTITSDIGTVIISENGEIVFTPDQETEDATVTVQTENENGDTVTQTFIVNAVDNTVVSEPVVIVNVSDIDSDIVKADTTTSNSTDIIDESGDNIVSAAEAATSDISGSIEVGSTINSLSITDGTNTVTVDPVDISINTDGSYSVENVDLSSLNDGTLTTSLTSTDAAGNSTTSSDTIEKDTTAAEGTVTVNDITTDDVINATE
ncbi:MAG: hypothetical protein U9Q20_00280, partial [Campylobacterota bacterium]|nr:hypothetical protein [Campylobacterota bacterium]